jgi:hypothetical protein
MEYPLLTARELEFDLNNISAASKDLDKSDFDSISGVLRKENRGGVNLVWLLPASEQVASLLASSKEIQVANKVQRAAAIKMMIDVNSSCSVSCLAPDEVGRCFIYVSKLLNTNNTYMLTYVNRYLERSVCCFICGPL